ERSPEKTPGDLEQREKADKAGCDCACQLAVLVGELGETDRRVAEEIAAEGFLQHRRGRADDADASRAVHRKDEPDEPELRRLVRVAEMDVAMSDHGAG